MDLQISFLCTSSTSKDSIFKEFERIWIKYFADAVNNIKEYLPEAKIKYGENGSDPRNYKVSFKKAKETLGFEPKYTVKNGIEELIKAFELGVYIDSLENKNKYGNYIIKY